MPDPAAPSPRPDSVEIADDHELLRATAGGDREAFRWLVHRHQDRVLKLAGHFLGHADSAEDVCQDAFLRIFENAGRITPDAQFSTWLYRVVANLCWDARRRAKRARRFLLRPAPQPRTGADPVDESERRDAVRRAVDALPDRQRLVILLHRFEELSVREISEVTGWSTGAVESCLVRAYASLRRKLAHLKEH